MPAEKKPEFKVDKGCRFGRSYKEFEAFMEDRPYDPARAEAYRFGREAQPAAAAEKTEKPTEEQGEASAPEEPAQPHQWLGGSDAKPEGGKPTDDQGDGGSKWFK